MNTDLALMRLLQIVSPALPIGAFAYSQGLEQTVSEGWVTTEAEARGWLLGLLESSFATLDLPVLARLMNAWRGVPTPLGSAQRSHRGRSQEPFEGSCSSDALAVTRWSRWLLACRPTRELRAEDRQLGASLARVLESLGIADAAAWTRRADVTHAAMFGLAAVRFDVAPGAALAGHAFAWAEAITTAAVRLVPLGQSAGQRILAAAGAAIPAIAARALTLPDQELGAAAPGQAIASATHEGLYSRLFRS
ncbi:MAG TPA: urease accessory UreF family protein [Polyangia bacterium]|nr:urease accessory UreF family protein [Polyangia bacterium]